MQERLRQWGARMLCLVAFSNEVEVSDTGLNCGGQKPNKFFAKSLILLLCLFAICPAAAEPTVVSIPDDDWRHSPTDTEIMNSDAGDYDVLVIPVIGTDSSYDPANNLVDNYDPTNPDLHAEIVAKWATTKDYWLEETWDTINIRAKVLNRYYMMPNPTDYYVNPNFEEAFLESAPSVPSPSNVPAGQLVLDFGLSEGDSQRIPISFDMDAGALSSPDLADEINNQLNPLVGDQISAEYDGTGNTLRFSVPDRFVRAGTHIAIHSDSDEDVLEALGFLEYAIDLAAKLVTSSGLELPFTATAETRVRFRVRFPDASTETLQLRLPAGTYTTPQDIVDNAIPDTAGTISLATAAGGELDYELAPSRTDSFDEIEVLSVFGGGVDSDMLGLEKGNSSEGVITSAARNTVKGDRRKIVGESIGAYMVNELTGASPGPDEIGDIAITAANQARLRTAFVDNIDKYHAISVVFLDASNKRAGASGNWLPIRIQNGAYEFNHTTVAKIQIGYASDPGTTTLHETGHNLGFADFYDNGNGNYDESLNYPAHWEQMAAQRFYPSVGGYVRSVESDWLTRGGASIETFSEPMTMRTDTKQYLLTPLEAKPTDYDAAISTPAGRTKTKLIRLPIGRGDAGNDHALLIQNRQENSHPDADYPPIDGNKTGGLYITDTITHNLFNYFLIPTRNLVHPLTDKPLLTTSSSGLFNIVPSVRPITDAGPGTDDIDLASAYPPALGIDVDIVGNVAGPDGRDSLLVDVSRTQSDYLDLSITPWGAPPWESPDIWVEHGDTATPCDAPLEGNGEPTRWARDYDQAAAGHPLNWICVKITNNGTESARNVRLEVRVNSPGGMGASGSWTPLPSSQTEDIPAEGGTAIFRIPWNPSVDDHTCVQAQIFRWESAAAEVNFANNQTQENIVDFEVESESPWKPGRFEFEIGNPFGFTLPVEMMAENLMYGMKVEFDKAYLEVPPRTQIESGGRLVLDETIIPPPVPDGRGGLIWSEPLLSGAAPAADGTDGGAESVEFVTGSQILDVPLNKPRRRPIHIGGQAIVDGHSRVPVGGITLNTVFTRSADAEFSVTSLNGRDIRVTGATTPVAAGVSLEILTRYPSGNATFTPIITGPDGRFDETVTGVEDGPVIIELRPGQPGQFSVEVDTAYRFNPVTGETSEVEPNSPLAPLLPCTQCFTKQRGWTVGVSLGAGFPHGAIGGVNTGFSGALNVDFKIGTRLSVGAQLSGQLFGQPGGGDDLDLIQAGPTVRVEGFRLGCFATYLRGGLGAYWLDGDAKFGGHVGAGISRCIGQNWSVSAEYQYHMIDSGMGEFSAIRIGVNRKF